MCVCVCVPQLKIQNTELYHRLRDEYVGLFR